MQIRDQNSCIYLAVPAKILKTIGKDPGWHTVHSCSGVPNPSQTDVEEREVNRSNAKQEVAFPRSSDVTANRCQAAVASSAWQTLPLCWKATRVERGGNLELCFSERAERAAYNNRESGGNTTVI